MQPSRWHCIRAHTFEHYHKVGCIAAPCVPWSCQHHHGVDRKRCVQHLQAVVMLTACQPESVCQYKGHGVHRERHVYKGTIRSHQPFLGMTVLYCDNQCCYWQPQSTCFKLAGCTTHTCTRQRTKTGCHKQTNGLQCSSRRTCNTTVTSCIKSVTQGNIHSTKGCMTDTNT